MNSICSQTTDGAILAALEDLPKDLPNTFNRILRKLQLSNAADSQLCRKIFNLVAAAQRPLTLEELREAVSVIPGEKSWDTSKLVNDMLRLLLDSCGSLVAVDEEHLTVQFAHHSIKQHLLSEPMDAEMKKYHIDMKEADLCLGDIIVTYLNFDVFDRRLTKAKSVISQEKHYPSAILSGSLPRSNIANRLAVRILKSRGNTKLDFQSQLRTAAGIVSESKETQPAHSFFLYAQEYWLFHTKFFKPSRVAGYTLWQKLINGDHVRAIGLPWAPKKWHDFGYDLMEWITQNEHWALIDQSLVTFTKNPSHYEATKFLIEFLENEATDVDIDFDAALHVASSMNNKAVVLLSLEKGADINAHGGIYGSALQAASYYGYEEIGKVLLKNGAMVDAVSEEYSTTFQTASVFSHEEIVRLLLKNGDNANAKVGHCGTALQTASLRGHEGMARLLMGNGANVNAEGGYFGNALQAASYHGHEDVARLLIENGASVNAAGGYFGTALQAASYYGHEDIARLLLAHGANVNAESGYYGTALQAAAYYIREDMVGLLLRHGADVNAEAGFYGTALHAAAVIGHEEIVRRLLQCGAVATSGTMEAASSSGNGDVKKLIGAALMISMGLPKV